MVGESWSPSKMICFFTINNSIGDYAIFRLESEGNYERAACISIFNDNVEGAIQIFVNASKTSNAPSNIKAQIIT